MRAASSARSTAYFQTACWWRLSQICPRESIQTPPAVSGGPIEISVDKAHVIGFAAGRAVAVLSLPEGNFVEVVGDASADETLVLPQGASLRRMDLKQPWVVSLPTPTRTFFWFGKDLRSFQGPVTLPEF